MTGVYRIYKNGKPIEYYPEGPDGEPPQYDMEYIDVVRIIDNGWCGYLSTRSKQIFPLIEGDKITIECLLRD
jgi:hypothetical protein